MEILIETKRLLIRELLPINDLGMFEMDNDPEVHYYVEPETAKTIEDSKKTIEFIRMTICYLRHWSVGSY